MSMNRITNRPTADLPGGTPRAGTYWVLRTEKISLYVDARTALRIARQLGRWWGPRWLAFRDRAGSTVRVRRADVRSLVESTPTTRAADRRLELALEGEEREQRPPWMEGL